ncbi:hypothetical protein SAMN05216412_11340 [Nitrosospira multiformis]|uniref:Uncharacterized protein n=1 Tax=Nitrosospira multiformis TaxID=1231 RepID=A0A1I0GG63_9PROT|nr:hypothetical protein SAMN05216412_11340 [Nitrosospira multiformis]
MEFQVLQPGQISRKNENQRAGLAIRERYLNIVHIKESLSIGIGRLVVRVPDERLQDAHNIC